MSEQFGSPNATNDDRLWAALAYVFSPILPIILLLLDEKKNRPYIRFHSIQALVTGVIMVVALPILTILTHGLGGVVGLVMFFWAYLAYQGEKVEIPIITDFIKNQGWV